MLVGLWRPTSGGIYLDGHNTHQWNRDNFGKYVGYLPQSVSLLEGTVADNIARLSDADPADIIAAAKKAGVHEMIGALPNGYETIVGDSLYTLSAGQRQRIGLARALFGGPRLIVLDEPNASLDVDGDKALIAAIESAKREGAIVIVISHKPAIMVAADKIMVLREGMVDLYGPRAEVLSEVSPRHQKPSPPPERIRAQLRPALG
jgi:ATP-binding cassette subfamily C protein